MSQDRVLARPDVSPRPVVNDVSSLEKEKQSAEGFEVWIHIYDLGPWSKWVLNKWVMRTAGPTVGAFHVGVEVCGVELAYQALMGESDRTGVWAHEPRRNPAHVYRESVFLGRTPMALAEIQELVSDMSCHWLAKSYHYVNKNCVDFAEEFVTRLRTPLTFPRWTHGLAKGFLLHTPLASVESKLLPKWCGSCTSCESGSCESQPCQEGGLWPAKLEVPAKQAL
jgi:hypothetical protein